MYIVCQLNTNSPIDLPPKSTKLQCICKSTHGSRKQTLLQDECNDYIIELDIQI